MERIKRNTRPISTESAAVLAGGERSVINFTPALLSFSDMKGATVLRAVSSEIRDAVATFPWNDHTRVPAHVVQWRLCFPSAWVANLSDTTVLAEAFVRLRNIVKLNLARSRFPVAVFVAGHYPQLSSLNLSKVEFESYEEDGYLTEMPLAALQCPQLTNLDVSHCSGLTGLAGLHCPLLTNLNLSSCKSVTGAALAGLQYPLLTNLSLSFCSGLTSLEGLNCPVLTKLDLSYCRGITDAALTGLHCPLLANLNLLDCRGLSGAALAGLH
jgi:Leucine-rich repeat (LRR) protein